MFGVPEAKDKYPGTVGAIENVGSLDLPIGMAMAWSIASTTARAEGRREEPRCKAKQPVVITKEQVKILDQMKFVTDSATSSPTSNNLLDFIAKVLLGHLGSGRTRSTAK